MSETVNCSSIRQSLLTYLGDQTFVTQIHENVCVVTLPIRTLDGRYVDVYVEPRVAKSYLVHDGAKAYSELFTRGIKISGVRQSLMGRIAAQFDVNYASGKFQDLSVEGHLKDRIWAVAEASAMAMSELLKHTPVFEETSALGLVSSMVENWAGKQHITLGRGVSVQGRTKKHAFDLVAFGPVTTVAIDVLSPSSGAMAGAERYGFKTLDTADTEAAKWKKLVILDKGKQWSADSQRLIQRFSDSMILVSASVEIDHEVVGSLDNLAHVA